MKSKSTTVIAIIAILFALAVAAILWLGNAHVMPEPQVINQAIPDDRIPH